VWRHTGGNKHDGFRVIARKDDKRVKLYSRPGNDLTCRFPLIVEAMIVVGAGQEGSVRMILPSCTSHPCTVTQKKINPSVPLVF
jgi:hypothetical protein